jgi:hypothetical protein
VSAGRSRIAPSFGREVIAINLDSEDERTFYVNATGEEREAFIRGRREPQ